jgi:hypothetical protein
MENKGRTFGITPALISVQSRPNCVFVLVDLGLANTRLRVHLTRLTNHANEPTNKELALLLVEMGLSLTSNSARPHDEPFW